MNLLDHIKEQGKALVIRGPHGRDNFMLARQLAEDRGSYSETDIDEITAHPNTRFRIWLRGSPKTVIVGGFPKPNSMTIPKSLIASNELVYECKGKDPININTPVFIFCTSEPEPIDPAAINRRFFTITIG